MKSLLLSAAALALASAARRPAFQTDEFRALGRSDPKATVSFTAALPMRNEATLERLLMAAADPDSPTYGQWLSQSEVNELTAPDASVRADVHAHLKRHGAKCIDWPSALRCKAPVAGVEKMLKTKMTAFHHVPKDKVIHRVHPDQGWTFPAALAGKLQFLTGLADYPTVRRRNGRIHAALESGAPADTDYIVVMETLQRFYNFSSAAANGNVGSSGGPAEFQDDSSWSADDAKAFGILNSLPELNVTKDHIVGPFDPSSPDAEASLDIQYMASVMQGDTAWYWTEADWQYEFVQHVASLPDASVPKVFSISWGWSEAQQCTIDSGNGPCSAGTGVKASYAYVNATNSGFMAMGARGISVMVSSGDSGAHGRTDPSCATAKVHPDWPAASPYITAVGATQITNGVAIANPQSSYCKNPTLGPCAQSGTEVVCSTATGALIVSGGGFSNVATTPTWQADAVKAYLASGATTPGTGNFNANGRGYPDVAVVGHNYIISLGGPTQVDGTSCSSPVFAGMVSNLNAIRIAAGKPVLGFLNPLIYKWGAAGAFKDIVTGNNDCTEDTSPCPSCTGFTAAAGWDPTTGWGVPNYEQLAKLVAALP